MTSTNRSLWLSDLTAGCRPTLPQRTPPCWHATGMTRHDEVSVRSNPEIVDYSLASRLERSPAASGD